MILFSFFILCLGTYAQNFVHFLEGAAQAEGLLVQVGFVAGCLH